MRLMEVFASRVELAVRLAGSEARHQARSEASKIRSTGKLFTSSCHISFLETRSGSSVVIVRIFCITIDGAVIFFATLVMVTLVKVLVALTGHTVASVLGTWDVAPEIVETVASGLGAWDVAPEIADTKTIDTR